VAFAILDVLLSDPTVVQVRNVQGISTSVYTFAAFLGAFTLFVELVMAAVRFRQPDSKPAYLLSEIAVNGIVWVMWLGKSRLRRLVICEARY